ncbi:GTP-binding protein EngB [Chryseobacterium carnipullorum]|uniref:GTP-binding protein EngB n=1 Tax=Chryseobacterium carnipullorum TaxID=1124835 RepID=UPI000E7FBC26|nr:GTP-binding protein EngB [Chryseobacterium carnipullorum]HBV15071.1 GTP-binding protein EngB [Chryseobacterium carnipullorum]
MINEEKLKKSITAIHDLLIKIKIMTVNNSSHLEMYNLIDDLEYLPLLILEQEDRTDIFNDALKDLCEKHNFLDVIKKYENG